MNKAATARTGTALRHKLQRVLVGLSWFGVFHPRTVLTLCFIATLAASYWAAGLRLSTDLADLLPDIPAAQRLRELRTHFGGTEPLVVAITGHGADDIEERIALAQDVREHLRDNPRFSGTMGLFGEDPVTLLTGPQAEALLVYLEPAELDRLAARLTADGVAENVARNLEALNSPIGPLTAQLVAADPLGFAGLALRHLGALRGRLTISVREGVVVSDDEQVALVLLRPNGPTQDTAFDRLLIGDTLAAARQALDDAHLVGTVGVGPAPPGADAAGIHIGLTGAPAFVVDYRKFLASDLARVSVISLVANLALYLVAFRRWGSLLVAGLALWVGLTWSLGFTALVIGGINVFTAGSVAILCGLAIDPTIHLYNRYLEEVHAGRDMERAFAIAHGETGLGILAVAATTALAFLAAAVSSFSGIRDLGIICAAGMLLSLVASLVLVPAITSVLARVKPSVDRPRGLSGFGLAPVLRFVQRRPRTVVAIWVILTAALAWPVVRLRLDEDFGRFRPQTAPSIQLQSDLARRTGTGLQPILALVPGTNDEEIIAREALLEAALDPLTRGPEGVLSAVLGPSRLVPPLARQERALAQLRELRAQGRIDPARVEADLLREQEARGFNVDAGLREAAARARRMLERDRPLTVAEAARGPLGAVLHELIVEQAPGRRLGVTSLYLRPDAKTGDVVPRLRAAIQASGVPAELVGARVLSQELKPTAVRDGVLATILSTCGVLVVLLITFRRIRLALLTLLPLLVSVFVSIGLIALLRIDFNVISLSMLPLLIGMGIDNGIHVVHRFRDGQAGEFAEALRHTGRGLVMTALTTMVGFAALFFADNPGLVASAWLVVLGIGASLLTAVTLLPALLLLFQERG